MNQLVFDFPNGLPLREFEPAVWLAASQRALPSTLQRLFEAPGGMIVDAVSAATALSSSDIIMVRGKNEQGFSVYASVRFEAVACMLLRRLKDLITKIEPKPQDNAQVRELLVFGFASGGINKLIPPRSATGLERAIARLRHRDARQHPSAILATCVRLEQSWPKGADELLHALVLRERADALRRLGSPLEEYKPIAQQAARFFEEAGRLSLAQCTLRHDQGVDFAQLHLPLETSPPRQRQMIPNLGYRAEKLFGRRLTLSEPLLEGEISKNPAQDWHWRRVGHVEISDETVCRALAGANGRTLGASATLTSDKLSLQVRLKTGFETELAVLLGIAGRTGEKPGCYSAKVYSASCSVSPWSVENPVGVLSEFVIYPQKAGRHRLEVELRTTSNRTANLLVNLNA